MLNTENEPRSIITRVIDCLPLVYLVYPQENSGVSVIMAPITEQQEKLLDDDQVISVVDQFDRTFIVNPKNCYAYGKLDLSPNSDNIETIAKANWFKYFYVNIILTGKYDYNTHTVTSDVVGGRWYETDNIKDYLPYLHGKIGKPERVVIFKDVISLLELRKKNRAKNNKLNRKHYNTCKDYYQSYNKTKALIKRQNKISNLIFTIKK